MAIRHAGDYDGDLVDGSSLREVGANLFTRVLQRRTTGAMDMTCTHLEAVTTVRHPTAHECDECVKMGSRWVHLRTCQTCGITRCCDSSPNRHASRHARGSGHPVIASAEEGDRWLYCFADDAFAEY